MIDWAQADLRQSELQLLNCAAGNYFVLYGKKRERERERGITTSESFLLSAELLSKSQKEECAAEASYVVSEAVVET